MTNPLTRDELLAASSAIAYRLKHGDIDDMDWSRDGSRVLFTYGESSQNVVLIRNFR